MNLNSIKKCPPLYRTLLLARQVGGRTWMRIRHRARGIQPRRVLFSSFHGRSYTDSPRRISEALHEMRPDIEIVWQLPDGVPVPDYVRTVPPRSLRALTELATVRCFVDNFNRPLYLLKFPGQLYVQTWHGDRGFKKVLFDMNDGLKYPDGGQMDLAVSGSDFGTRVFRSAFHYEGEVLQTGMPRNDALVNRDFSGARRAKKALNLPDDARILLYAPTFRDATAGGEQQAGFSVRRALDALRTATGEHWICLARAHDLNRSIGSDGAVDATDYPEMADLLLAADLLITDYSSSAGDFALLNRPMILYQPDLKQFISDDRSMYFDLKTSPFVRAESEDELMHMLAHLPDLPLCSENVLKFYGAQESGHSAEAAAQWISDHIEK